MARRQPFPVGGRRGRRPSTVRRCVDCGELSGRGYPDCVTCADVVDGPWRADWTLLLATTRINRGGDAERELAKRVLADDIGAHPWTCVDWAMSMSRCPECRAESATGPVGCVRCWIAEERRWVWEHSAPAGTVTANEHALRAARAALRAPHRQGTTMLLTWRLALPFLLTGEIEHIGSIRWIRAYLRAGRYEELASCGSYRQFAGIPELPWR